MIDLLALGQPWVDEKRMLTHQWAKWLRRVIQQINDDGDAIAANTAVIAIINAQLAAGFTGTITTAKLTPGGANGSMTFTNGVLTASTPAN